MAAGWTLSEILSSGWRGAGIRRAIVSGPLFVLVGLLALAILMPTPSGGHWQALTPIVIALSLVGFGIGFGWPHLLTRILQVAPEADKDIAGASITTVQLFATAFGAALALLSGMTATAVVRVALLTRLLVGGALEATGNGLDGVKVDQLSSLTIGITEFGEPGNAVVAGNQGHGINVSGGSNLDVSEIMPLASRENALSGLFVDGGSNVEVNGSSIEDNEGADVELTFGAIATLNDNVIGDLVCDGTALSRGTTTCP